VPFSNRPRPETLKSLSNIKLTPFWLDDPSRPEPAPLLTESTTADLLVIGGGFTGLWTALQAREADPSRDVVLLEGGEIATGASGRNGGFMASSLTHSFENGHDRWPKELSTLVKMGHENLDGIEASIQRHHIECDFLRSGELVVATEPYQVDDLRATVKAAAPYGEAYQWREKDDIGVHSPLYLGALFDPSVAMVNPAQLAWGLRRACLELGVRLFERSQVTGLEEAGNSIVARTAYGQIQARRVALATNAFPPLLKRLSYYVVPVYDYVLMSEPLSAEQRASIGWDARQGVGDCGNQFHYYRTTADGRILWGGYDAIYHWDNGFGPQLEHNFDSFARLAEHFFATFPQLAGLRFTHAWGGAIDTCSRFSTFWGTAHNGRTAYAMGFTGLGVGASRFGAQVMLDLLDEKKTARTALEMVSTKPVPFPPEPFRSAAVNVTRWSLDQADQHQGRRNLWLKVLDSLGLGFDS
jgi:glycine/D-amino acid oxidase-like deaminating enzyme